MTPDLKKLNLDIIQSSVSPRASRRQERKKTNERKARRWVKWILVAFLILLVAFIFMKDFSSGSGVFRYVFSGQNSLKNDNGRVNVLLLGIGGGNHDGPNLTDSIIVASYDLKTNNVTMFSIPRDLWLDSIKEKVNAAYQIGINNGSGLAFAEDKIDDILGIKINYGVVIDFAGFSKAIDLVGGVDVDVPDTFDDYEYPIEGKENDLCGLTEQEMDVTPQQASATGLQPGKQKVLLEPSGQIATSSADFACRFEHIHFDKGLTHMDGATALKFVRSRHGTGIEGSDFARSRRQQLVIQAFRSKALSAQTIFNPQKIGSLIDTFGQSVVTDIPKDQLIEIYSLSKKVKHTNSVVLGDLGNGKSLFINPPVSDYGAWVLIPPDNNLTLVSDFVKTTLASDSAQPKQ